MLNLKAIIREEVEKKSEKDKGNEPREEKTENELKAERDRRGFKRRGYEKKEHAHYDKIHDTSLDK